MNKILSSGLSVLLIVLMLIVPVPTRALNEVYIGPTCYPGFAYIDENGRRVNGASLSYMTNEAGDPVFCVSRGSPHPAKPYSLDQSFVDANPLLMYRMDYICRKEGYTFEQKQLAIWAVIGKMGYMDPAQPVFGGGWGDTSRTVDHHTNLYDAYQALLVGQIPQGVANLHAMYALATEALQQTGHGTNRIVIQLDKQLTEPLSFNGTVYKAEAVLHTTFSGTWIIEQANNIAVTPSAGGDGDQIVFTATPEQYRSGGMSARFQAVAPASLPEGGPRPLSLFTSNGQTIVAFDAPVMTVIPDPVVFNFTPELGSLKIQKRSTDNQNIAGITFRLAGMGLDLTLVTDNNGIAGCADLPAGTYVVSEPSVPEGYSGEAAKQVTIASGQQTRVEFLNTRLYGSLQITKTSENGTVSGIAFRIQGAGVDKTVVTDAHGQILVPDLLPGRYVVSEITPAEYVTQPAQTIQVVANQTARLSFANRLRRGKVRIVKTSDDQQPLAGVGFQVQGSGGYSRSVLTGADGVVELTDLLPGAYTIRETKVPAGYLPLAPVHIQVDADTTAIVRLTNQRTRFVISKQDISDAKPVPGSGIQIRDGQNEVVYQGITDAQGQLTIVGLPAGAYTFRETVAPNGYALNPNIYPFTLRSDGTVSGRLVLSDEPTAIRIHKSVAGGDSLPGARFKLMKDNEVMRFALRNGQYMADAQGTIRELQTNDQGLIDLIYLPAGIYQLHETEAPQGFKRDESIVTLNLTAHHSQSHPLSIERTNLKWVPIHKTDLTNGKPVPGATIVVTDAKTGSQVYRGQTDHIGQCLPALPAGSYYFQEVLAPDGYAFNRNRFEFVVQADGEVTGQTDFADDPSCVVLVKTLRGGTAPVVGAVYQVCRKGTDQPIRFRKEQNCFVASADGSLDQLGTDAQGRIEIRYLPLGSYQIKELAAPEGYDRELGPVAFELNEDHSTQNPLTIRVSDTRQHRLSKRHLASAQPVPGAEITVTSVSTGQIIFREITDRNGQIHLRNLSAGTYLFQETAAPEGFDLNPEVFTFVVRPDGVIEGDDTITDERTVAGQIRIIKKTEDTDQPMDGVRFQVVDEEDSVVSEGVTNQEGQFLTGILPAGDYRIREIETGHWQEYALAAEKLVQINQRPDWGEPAVIQDVLIRNYKLASIRIQKISGADTRKPIAHVRYGIFRRLDETRVATLTTDENGCAVALLPPGSYRLVEEAAAVGYIMDPEPIDVALEWGQAVSYTLMNQPEPIPKAGESDGEEIAIGLVSLVFCGGLLLLRRKLMI